MLRHLILVPTMAFFISFLAVGAHAEEGTGFRPFVRGEYGADDFSVTSRTYSHGRLKVKVTQAKSVGSGPGGGASSCNAWLEVAEGGKDIWQRSFEGTRPAGFSYGLFVPPKQPSQRYFAVIKAGDNDGRLFLVDRDTGMVFDLPGGLYFTTVDSRYLFSEYVGETQDVVVFDLAAGKVVLDTKTSDAFRLPGDIYDWYYDGRRFFFTTVRDDGAGVLVEDRKTLYEVKLARPGIEKVPADFSGLHHKRWDFDPRRFADCFSEPGKTKEEKPGQGQPK